MWAIFFHTQPMVYAVLVYIARQTALVYLCYTPMIAMG